MSTFQTDRIQQTETDKEDGVSNLHENKIISMFPAPKSDCKQENIH